MTSHGVSRHGRYERLLRRHRLDTHSDDDQETLHNHGTVHDRKLAPNNLHDEWVAMHEKRQVENPSTTAVLPNPETTSTSDSRTTTTTENATTTTESNTEPTTATTTTSLSETADNSGQETNEPSSAKDADPSTTVTGVTIVATTASWPTSTESESDDKLTTTTVPEAAAATSEEQTESAAKQTPAATTTDSVGGSPTTTSSDTESLSQSTSESLSESFTESVSQSLSESLTEVADIIATVGVDGANTLIVTQESLPISTPTSTYATIGPDAASTSSVTGSPASLTSAIDSATSPSISTSAPIISQPSGGSNDSPISWGPSLDIPTAVISTQSSSNTPLTMMGGIISGEISMSISDTDSFTSSTNTTTTTTPSLTSTTTSTTSTSENSYDTNSNTHSQSGSGWGGGGSETAGASPESTDSSGIDSGSSAPSQQTTGKIVGGVVGGVAGASLIFLLIFLILRRRRKTGFFFGSPANPIAGGGGGGVARENSTRQMVSRNSNKDSMFGAAYFAPAFMKRWRQSQVSTGEESIASTTPSERGFQKISGRKLPSGYQPGLEYSAGGLEAGSPTDSDLSPTLPPTMTRYPLSSKPPPSNPFSHPLDTSFTREVDDDVVFMRPSPARTPTAGSSNTATWGEASARPIPMAMAFPMPPGAMAIPKRPDALGRSHPSYDGSRGSRFTESL
ncbi:hypothetical protein BJX99DRAFT_222799 [Aspergillus californicus]